MKICDGHDNARSGMMCTQFAQRRLSLVSPNMQTLLPITEVDVSLRRSAKKKMKCGQGPLAHYRFLRASYRVWRLAGGASYLCAGCR
jgi:hypothetical protein